MLNITQIEVLWTLCTCLLTQCCKVSSMSNTNIRLMGFWSAFKHYPHQSFSRKYKFSLFWWTAYFYFLRKYFRILHKKIFKMGGLLYYITRIFGISRSYTFVYISEVQCYRYNLTNGNRIKCLFSKYIRIQLRRDTQMVYGHV